MNVSFMTLFRRSRYSNFGAGVGLGLAEGSSEERKQQEQHERFAVGTIGFALERDPNFREHFVSIVWGSKPPEDFSKWEVFVEPDNWGDLVLVHRPSSSLLVVEFKIDCKLRPHQNPSKNSFTSPGRNGECDGYGREILSFANRERLTNLRYVTVQKKASWPDRGKPTKQVNGIVCTPLDWGHFLRANVSGESLESDVYDCLAHLGVYVFFGRNMSNKRLALNATEPLRLLAGVLEEAGARFKRSLFDGSPREIGLNLEAEYFPNIKDLVNLKPERRITGWIGYQSDPGPELSVWVYCYNSKRPEDANKRTRAKLQAAGFKGKDIQEDSANYNLGVKCKGAESMDDRKWFRKVLDVLNG